MSFVACCRNGTCKFKREKKFGNILVTNGNPKKDVFFTIHLKEIPFKKAYYKFLRCLERLVHAKKLAFIAVWCVNFENQNVNMKKFDTKHTYFKISLDVWRKNEQFLLVVCVVRSVSHQTYQCVTSFEQYFLFMCFFPFEKFMRFTSFD